MAARAAHELPLRQTPTTTAPRRQSTSLYVSAKDLLEHLQHARRTLLTKLETNDIADATMNMRRHAAKRGNVRPDFWRSMPMVSRRMVRRNQLLGRRAFLGLGAALTGVALGARPGRVAPAPCAQRPPGALPSCLRRTNRSRPTWYARQRRAAMGFRPAG